MWRPTSVSVTNINEEIKNMSNNITAEEARSNMGKGISEAVKDTLYTAHLKIREASGINESSSYIYVHKNVLYLVTQELHRDGFHTKATDLISGEYRLNISWAEEDPFVIDNSPWWKFWH